MLLSIVIVSWNTRELLRRCLASVEAERAGFPEGNLETIVIDNASVDGSADMVRAEFPRARLFVNADNAGFARANNQGIHTADSEYILLLNPDTELLGGALCALVDFMRSTPRAGAAGACLLNPDGTLQNSAYPMPGLFREAWRLLSLDSIQFRSRYPLNAWASLPPRRVEVAQGASLLLRRTALDAVGVLDESYYMYTEEVDLCYRLAKRGWDVYWVPQAKVLHHGGQSTRQVAGEMFLRLYHSKVIFFRKHYGQGKAIAYKLLLAAVSLPRILLGFLRLSPDGRRLSANYWRLVWALPGF